MNRLSSMLSIHNELCRAAVLHESVRPYSIQSRLETLESFIMKEIEKESITTDNEDEIDF